MLAHQAIVSFFPCFAAAHRNSDVPVGPFSLIKIVVHPYQHSIHALSLFILNDAETGGNADRIEKAVYFNRRPQFFRERAVFGSVMPQDRQWQFFSPPNARLPRAPGPGAVVL